MLVSTELSLLKLVGANEIGLGPPAGPHPVIPGLTGYDRVSVTIDWDTQIALIEEMEAWLDSQSITEVIRNKTLKRSFDRVNATREEMRWSARIGKGSSYYLKPPPDRIHTATTASMRQATVLNQARTELAWYSTHVAAVTFLEKVPSSMPTGPRLGVSTSTFQKIRGPLWLHVVPHSPEHLLPAPGDWERVRTCLEWPETVPRVQALAERCDGPARWSRAWVCDFYMSCVLEPCGTQVTPDERRAGRRRVEDLWYEVAGEV